jgi:hypothetical protein
MAASKHPLDPYAPPEVVGDVEQIPPVLRERGISVYDPVIIAAVEREGRWVQVDPKGRTLQAFRNAILTRAEQLVLVLKVKQRGSLIYVRYDGKTEGVVEMIERVRKESRAQYGD